MIAGFTTPRRARPFFGALVLAVREDHAWRYIGHVGTGFSHKVLEDLYVKLVKLTAPKSPFPAKVKDEAATTWVKPSLVAEVKFAEWTGKCCASPSTSDSGPTSGPRMSCANESVRVNSDPFVPNRRTERAGGILEVRHPSVRAGAMAVVSEGGEISPGARSAPSFGTALTCFFLRCEFHRGGAFSPFQGRGFPVVCPQA